MVNKTEVKGERRIQGIVLSALIKVYADVAQAIEFTEVVESKTADDPPPSPFFH